MILNLLNTMLITLGTGASVLTMPKKPTPPINRLQQNFTLNIQSTNETNNLIQDGTTYQRTKTYKTNGNNQALLVKGNVITNCKYLKIGTDCETEYATTIASNKRTGSIYQCIITQITPYETTIDTEQHFRIYTEIGINETIFNNVNNDEIKSIKLYTTTYQTTEDWSQYIDRNDYASWNFIKNLQEEIESSENGYRYQQTEQITDMENRANGSEATGIVETELNITKGTTLYVIQITQPIIELEEPTNTQQIVLTTSEYVAGNAILKSSDYTKQIYITGTMIIPEGSTEIVDIPGLMFQVLTMPFTFISAAFNLTLFPGTPYQINISNLFMAIIAVMAFIFILKLLIGLKGGN